MSLDENQLIIKLISVLKNSNLLASNDDAVAIPIYDNKKDSKSVSNLCITLNVDNMAESTDFFIQGDMTWEDFGYKLVAITLSDIAAKGVKPSHFLSALSIPEKFTSKNIDNLIQGIKIACDEFKIDYLGGDLGKSKEIVTSGIAIGIGDQESLIRRDGAKIGDIVCTTGKYGWTGLAYKLAFENDSNIKKIVPSSIRKKAFMKVNRPKPRLNEGEYLGANRNIYGIHSSIDSSDGLIKSLKILTELSNVTIELQEIPIDKELSKIGLSEEFLLDIVFNGGEEFELIFLVEPMKVNELMDNFPSDITIIGKVTKRGTGLDLNNQKFQDKKLINHTKTWDSLKGNFIDS